MLKSVYADNIVYTTDNKQIFCKEFSITDEWIILTNCKIVHLFSGKEIIKVFFYCSPHIDTTSRFSSIEGYIIKKQIIFSKDKINTIESYEPDQLPKWVLLDEKACLEKINKEFHEIEEEIIKENTKIFYVSLLLKYILKCEKKYNKCFGFRKMKRRKIKITSKDLENIYNELKNFYKQKAVKYEGELDLNIEKALKYYIEDGYDYSQLSFNKAEVLQENFRTEI